jgi:hypothetical protein
MLIRRRLMLRKTSSGGGSISNFVLETKRKLAEKRKK